jgi:hypothetical protein
VLTKALREWRMTKWMLLKANPKINKIIAAEAIFVTV